MKLQSVDRIPADSNSFLTVTDSAVQAIQQLAQTKPAGCFRLRADILAKKTDWYFEWDDVFREEDFVVEVKGVEIVLDATTIAYILDEYTLDYAEDRFRIARNSDGPLRHQAR